MADPNALESKKPANTYGDLLHTNNANGGLDATLRAVYTGTGEATTLSLSDDSLSADCNYEDLERPTFVRPAYKAVSATHLSGAYAVDLSNANYYELTLEANIGSMSVSSAPPSDGVTRVVEIVFFIVQGGAGSFTVSWPANTKWASGSAPSLTGTVGATDIIRLTTFDNGSNWYGVAVAQNLT